MSSPSGEILACDQKAESESELLILDLFKAPQRVADNDVKNFALVADIAADLSGNGANNAAPREAQIIDLHSMHQRRQDLLNTFGAEIESGVGLQNGALQQPTYSLESRDDLGLLQKKVMARIIKDLGHVPYGNCLEKMSFHHFANNILTIAVPSKFIREFIINNYFKQIYEGIRFFASNVRTIDFRIIEGINSMNMANNRGNPELSGNNCMNNQDAQAANLNPNAMGGTIASVSSSSGGFDSSWSAAGAASRGGVSYPKYPDQANYVAEYNGNGAYIAASAPGFRDFTGKNPDNVASMGNNFDFKTSNSRNPSLFLADAGASQYAAGMNHKLPHAQPGMSQNSANPMGLGGGGYNAAGGNSNLGGRPATNAAVPRFESPYLASKLNTKLTFESFVDGSANKAAYLMANKFADSFLYRFAREAEQAGGLEIPSIYIYGRVGLGKTHLLHAIANKISLFAPQSQVLYVTAESFTQGYVKAVKQNRLFEFKNSLNNLDLLIVDDLQFICGRSGTEKELIATFDQLFAASKRIIVASSKLPQQLNFDQRTTSRLLSCFTVEIMAADFELRQRILERKLRLHYSENKVAQLITAEMLRMIAQKITSSVRELESVLHKLIAYCQIMEIAVSNELLEGIIKESCSHLDYADDAWAEATSDKSEGGLTLVMAGQRDDDGKGNGEVKSGRKISGLSARNKARKLENATAADPRFKGGSRRGAAGSELEEAVNKVRPGANSQHKIKAHDDEDRSGDISGARRKGRVLSRLDAGAAKIIGEGDLKRVIARIGQWCGASSEAIVGRSRGRNLSMARRIFALFAKKILQINLRQIGVYLGNRNHSTIVYILQNNPKNEAELKMWIAGNNAFKSISVDNKSGSANYDAVLQLLSLELSK